MAGVVEIVNRALSKLGEQHINSLDDEVKAAAEAKSTYEFVLKAELSAYRWNFAQRRVLLSSLKEKPVFFYENAYLLPSDCLRVLELGDWPSPNMAACVSSASQAYTIEDNKILTNLASPLAILYVAYVKDVTKYSAPFTEALAAKLAVEMAESLTGSTAKKEAAWKEYNFALNRAKRWGAIQRPPQHIQDDSWVWARGN